jgi:uncharacterized protein (TIGR02996 family)
VSDGDALLAAILADPKEDTPRLVYADWLEENGQEDRGKFIRAQCELNRRMNSKGPPEPKISTKPQKCKKCRAWYAGTGLCGCSYGRRRSEKSEQLQNERRGWEEENRILGDLQDNLILDRGYAFVDGAIGHEWDTMGARKDGPTVTVRYILQATRGNAKTDLFTLGFHRGFITSVACAWHDWESHAERLLKSNPIEMVALASNPVMLGHEIRGQGALRELKNVWPKIKFELPSRWSQFESRYTSVSREELIRRMREAIH